MFRHLIAALNKTRYLGYIAAKHYGVHPKHLIKRELWYMRYLKEGDVALDIGSDYHLRHSRNAAKVCSEVQAFDPWLEPVKDGKITAIKHDAMKPFPYRDAYFDKVLYLDVIEHLPETDNSMREVVRVLKPGGLLLLSLPNSRTPWKLIKKRHGLNYFSDSDHRREYTLAEAKRLVADYGLELLEAMPATRDTPLIGFIDATSLLSLSLYRRLSLRNVGKATMENTMGFHMVARKPAR